MRTELGWRLLGSTALVVLLSAAVVLPGDSLIDAARKGDVEMIRTLVQNGADVNAAEGDGMTPLHYAAERNSPEAARILLYAGARIDARTRIGAYTPLLVASRVGNAGVMEVLLEAGADVRHRTSTGGMTALHFAAAAGNPRAVELLLQRGAEVNAREKGSDHTPLMVAAAMGRTEAARVLLAHGADIHVVNRVLDMAEREQEDNRDRQLRNQRVTMLRDLERQANGGSGAPGAQAEEAEAPAQQPAEEAEATNREDPPAEAYAEAAPPSSALAGRWAIAFSVQGQPMDATLVLSLEDGALTGVLEGPQGPVPLQVTGEGTRFEGQGDAPQVGRITLEGEVEGSEISGAFGLGPMGTASFRGARSGDSAGEETSPEEVREEEAPRSRFARAAAARGGAEEEDARPLTYAENVAGHGGFTALHLAVRQGATEIVMDLLAAGADLNLPSEGDRSTPLLMAVVNGHWDLAMHLLEQGADPNLPSIHGATPLYGVVNLQWAPRAFYPQPRAHLNQQTEYLDLMEALLKAGADPNVRLTHHLWYKSFNFDVLNVHSEGATAFWRAAYATDVRAMRLLRQYGADPFVTTVRPASRRGGYGGGATEDQSGLAPVPVGGPSVNALHAASGAGYGEGFAANAHRHVPGGWVPAARYLVEEVGIDINARDHNGFTALHHAASRGDADLIRYLVDQGADVTAISRAGLTVADMANGPVQRTTPYPRAIELLLALGSPFNDNCVSC